MSNSPTAKVAFSSPKLKQAHQIDEVRINSIIARNLPPDAQHPDLSILFEPGAIEVRGKRVAWGRYDPWKRLARVSLLSHPAHQKAFGDYQFDMRLLHEMSHYIQLGGQGFLELVSNQMKTKLLATVGATATLAALASTQLSPDALPISNNLLTDALLVTGLGAASLEALNGMGLTPFRVQNYMHKLYEAESGEKQANDFVWQELALLNEPLITVAPHLS
jgi:hypothetical protein